MSIDFRRASGITLVELIIFIVIVSVGIVGILSVLNVTVMRSADPMVQKQAQAFAEGLLEEIQTAYFASCDGADPQLAYATAAAQCTGGVGDDYGPEAGEARPFDSVIDYGSAAGVATDIAATDLSGALAAPAGYTAQVTIDSQALGDIPAADALLITVVVTGPGATVATAEGFKTRQVPR
jgi:MSHA pilin protein MshD